jgi:hypothetical protein
MVFHDVVVLVALCFFSSYKALDVCFYVALPPLHHIRIKSFVSVPLVPFSVYLASNDVVLCEDGVHFPAASCFPCHVGGKCKSKDDCMMVREGGRYYLYSCFAVDIGFSQVYAVTNIVCYRRLLLARVQLPELHKEIC